MRHLFNLAILCLTLSLIACTEETKVYPANSRQKCETCNSSADCANNLYCVGFYNRNGATNRCADRNTTSCP